MSTTLEISSLSTYPAIGQIGLSWLVKDPGGGGSMAALNRVDVYAAASNNRSLASVVTNGLFSASHAVAALSTYYYWVKAVDNNGSESAFFPASATGGISGDEIIRTLTVPTVNSLLVSPGVGQISLTWTLTEPNANGLGRLALAKVEVYAASVNNRASASFVAQGINSATHFGLDGGALRYYWVRPIHLDGTAGAYFPPSATGGGFATTYDYFVGRLVSLSATGTDVPLAITHNGSGIGIDVTHTGSASYGVRSTKQGAGTYAFYASLSSGATAYGPFTGAHDGLIRKPAKVEPGDIVCDLAVMARSGISDTITEIEISSAVRQRNIVGVFVGRRPIGDDDEIAAIDDITDAMINDFDRAVFNGVGEGQINVCGDNGPIEAGDLLVTSSVPGKAMRQDDDLVRACTVARAREGAALATAADRAQIACIYLCG